MASGLLTTSAMTGTRGHRWSPSAPSLSAPTLHMDSQPLVVVRQEALVVLRYVAHSCFILNNDGN